MSSQGTWQEPVVLFVSSIHVAFRYRLGAIAERGAGRKTEGAIERPLFYCSQAGGACHMKIIAIANQKGGCGKTTTAINLAACLGKKNQRVLLLDLDPQGHSSIGFGVYSEEARSMYEVFTGEAVIEEIILPNVYMGVDLIPATMMLAAAEHLPVSREQRDRQLALHLVSLRDRYDYIVIDCPPSMGLLFSNALMVSNLVLIPVEMSMLGLNGIDRMYEAVAALRERQAREIPIRVLPTLIDSRTRLCREFLHEVGERFADEVMPVMVQFTVRLKEAVRKGVPIISYDPASPAAAQYDRLASELMSVLGTTNATTEAEAEEHEVSDAEERLTTAMTLAFEEARTRLIENGRQQKVVLRFYGHAGKEVQLAGDFNDWMPDRNVTTRLVDGVQEKILTLNPGIYQYRIIVDGEWQEDDSSLERVPNFSGGYNSLLHVEEEHEMLSV
jgi:chromosome partitioning protein